MFSVYKTKYLPGNCTAESVVVVVVVVVILVVVVVAVVVVAVVVVAVAAAAAAVVKNTVDHQIISLFALSLVLEYFGERLGDLCL